MMFRRLYWVTEQVKSDGKSSVTGVFTSIPNLVKEGLACNHLNTMRLSLTKLDCICGPLGTWCGPEFHGLKDRLAEFIETDEFSPEQCDSLVAALQGHSAGV